MSGLEVMARGDDLDQYVVHHVRAGSPGDSAGLKAGDQILIINHLEADNISLTRIYGILNSKAERKIRMVINRNGERKRFTFRLKREI
jgi:C-terminal processing protease CtpA/Prc